MGHNSEDELIAEATQVLGGSEQVLAAGVFGLKDLLGAQIAGGTAGALTGSMLSDVAGGALGAGLGGLAAKKAYAESQGVTMQLVVAVTPTHIQVLNRDTEGRLPEIVASFDRATTQVNVSKFGLSRNVDLSDTASGAHIALTGGVSPISSFSKGDKVVLQLLAA